VIEELAGLRSDERIVVAGSVSSLIDDYLKTGDGPLGSDRLVLLGEVSSFKLDCLIANAAGMLLPVTYGGGSNLKTAEALLAGHPIIGTTKAFRGCEVIAETPEAFSAAMRRVFAGEVPPPPHDERLGSIVWDQTLQPIVDLVGEVTARHDSPHDPRATCSTPLIGKHSDMPCSELPDC
jgi:hypothetical protein